MKRITVISAIMFILISCGENKNNATKEKDLKGMHEISVSEVLQTNNYTYLFAKENGKEFWLAVPSIEAEKGDIFYYDDGLLMRNFYSKELNRDFDEIIFLESVRKTANTDIEKSSASDENMTTSTGRVPQFKKENIIVTPVSGGISIAELYENKAKYAGKTVKVAGVVMKVNEAVMDKNWVHIQDGSEYDNKFDLTITTSATVKKGDEVVFEGKLSLDKDFGYGYVYEILLEDAVLKQKK
ncbi:MAG: hypothetical protein GXO50_08030 [Chlorobi bacterium]|nr:hypothetical protein [Chlorobiota bacterium]